MDTSVKTIYLARHPETIPPAEPSCLGQTDVGIKSSEPSAWEHITTAAKIFQPEVILSSDLQRCTIPARHTAEMLNVPLEIQPQWREIHFGEWDGLPWSAIEKKWPEEMNVWMKDFVNITPPAGESLTTFHARVSATLDLALNRPEERILVVTHSGVLRSIFCRIAESPLQKTFAVDFYFCSLLTVEKSPLGLRMLF